MCACMICSLPFLPGSKIHSHGTLLKKAVGRLFPFWHVCMGHVFFVTISGVIVKSALAFQACISQRNWKTTLLSHSSLRVVPLITSNYTWKKLQHMSMTLVVLFGTHHSGPITLYTWFHSTWNLCGAFLAGGTSFHYYLIRVPRNPPTPANKALLSGY